MKTSKMRKMQRSIVASKAERKNEILRVTNAQIKIRDDKWGEPNFQFWLTLVSHWQPIKK